MFTADTHADSNDRLISSVCRRYFCKVLHVRRPFLMFRDNGLHALTLVKFFGVNPTMLMVLSFPPFVHLFDFQPIGLHAMEWARSALFGRSSHAFYDAAVQESVGRRRCHWAVATAFELVFTRYTQATRDSRSSRREYIATHLDVVSTQSRRPDEHLSAHCSLRLLTAHSDRSQWTSLRCGLVYVKIGLTTSFRWRLNGFNRNLTA